MKTSLILLTLLISLSAPSLSDAAPAEQKDVYLQSDSFIYRDAKPTAEVLGKYRKGLKLKVFFPDRNGYYAVYYSTPIRGANYGWIPAQNVGFSSPENESAAQPSEFKKNLISVGVNFVSFSPLDFQAKLGEKASSISTPGFHFAYARRFTRKFFGEFRYEYYSFTNSLAASADPVNNFYYANGDLFTFSAGYYFIEREKFSLSASAGPGLSFSQAGDGFGQIVTQPKVYTAIYLAAKVNAAYDLYQSFSIYADLGYELHTISSVALINSLNRPLTADIALTTLLLDLGVRFRF